MIRHASALNLARNGFCLSLGAFALSERKAANEMRALTDKVQKTSLQTLQEIKELRIELESHKKLLSTESFDRPIDPATWRFIT